MVDKQDPAAGFAKHPADETMRPSLPLQEIRSIEHIVVIMFENRSFDNIFGYLYPSKVLPDGQKFEGLVEDDHWNIGPDGEKIHAHIYDTGYKVAIKSPAPDPRRASCRPMPSSSRGRCSATTTCTRP